MSIGPVEPLQLSWFVLGRLAVHASRISFIDYPPSVAFAPDPYNAMISFEPVGQALVTHPDVHWLWRAQVCGWIGAVKEKKPQVIALGALARDTAVRCLMSSTITHIWFDTPPLEEDVPMRAATVFVARSSPDGTQEAQHYSRRDAERLRTFVVQHATALEPFLRANGWTKPPYSTWTLPADQDPARQQSDDLKAIFPWDSTHR